MTVPSFRSVFQYIGHVAATIADQALIAFGGALDHRIANTAFNPRTSAASSPLAAEDPAGGDLAPPRPPGAASLPGHSNVDTVYQKSESCWCGEHLNAEGTETSVLMACSHFRIAHCHREPIETGLDHGASIASEFFPQHTK